MSISQTDLINLQKQQAEIVQQVYSKQDIAKTITTSVQPVGYNLSPLVACLEPMWEKYNIFLKKIPRVGPAAGQMGTNAQWWQINSVTNGMSSSYEGGLGTQNVTSTSLIQVPYKTIAVSDSVTMEAQASGSGFLDAKGSSVIRALRKIRQKEEYKIIGGNISALTAVSSIAAQAAAGGAITAGTYSIKVCPMTAECLQSLTVNANVSGLGLVPYVDINSNAIAGKFWGVGLPSSAASATTASSNLAITVTVTPTPDAFAYAIFAKTGSDAYTLQAITNYSTFTLNNYFTTGNAVPTVDGSADTLSFDGLLPQIIKAGNAYGADLAYGQFTPSQTGVTQINNALAGIFNAYKVAATNIYVSGDLRNTITQANIAKGGVFAVTQTSELNRMTVGRTVGTYIHPSTGEELSIETHPYLPNGTCLITTESLDLPELGVSNVIEMHVAQDYFQRDVYQSLRQYPFEVFAYEALGLRTPQYNAIIKNVAPGLPA